MESMLILGISIIFALMTAASPVFADSSDISKQTTISEDFENNPVAQDILNKIEKSERWIAQMEQRNFESVEKQKELEQKRAETRQILEDKLEKWEKIWEYYTFDKMLERALESSPVKDTDSIYDHPLKFTASKINAGRDALHKVLLEGGGPEEARDAFVDAAKITREEMFAVNSLVNVINNNAYYSQQILFNPDGSFEDTVSGDQLRKYYHDYRANPEYLQANPFDKISWTDLSKDNPDTKCRQGMVLVYRTQADDFVCTTEGTAEMWTRHKMGNIVTDTLLETIDPADIKKFQQDRIFEKVKNLNSKIQSIQKYDNLKMSETESRYDLIFTDMQDEQDNEERRIIKTYNESDSMSDKALSQKITDIREKYGHLEETVTKEKAHILEILEKQHQRNIEEFVKRFESDSEIKTTWNSQNPTFEVKMSS
ncbi:MAG: hypothetical protein GKS07_07745 [Nitrosopumilus sp.]|nr:MAG: hypothetical protein GKS07_07745 [Nitrosopumilus sp.]